MNFIKFQLNDKEVNELAETAEETIRKIARIIVEHLDRSEISAEEKVISFRQLIYMLTTEYTIILLGTLIQIDHELLTLMKKQEKNECIPDKK